MIVLDNGDKLRAGASAANVVDYTIHGVDGTVLKQLADGQLAAAVADIYTASDIVVVSTVIFVNTDTVTRTLNLYLLPSGGTARRLIVKDVTLKAGYSLHFSGKSVNIFGTDGALVVSYLAQTHASTHKDGGTDELDCAGLDGRVNMVSRGYFTGHDFTINDFTTDATWRELDLSAIVPAGTKFVHLRINLLHSAIGSMLILKKNGTASDNNNTAAWSTLVANVNIYNTFLVECDSDRKIEYWASNIVWGGIWLNILGWVI